MGHSMPRRLGRLLPRAWRRTDGSIGSGAGNPDLAGLAVKVTERKSWYFVIDLPRGEDGRRRQMFRRGFSSDDQAAREEQLARQQFGQTDLAADGTVAAELMQWLDERELDVAATTLSNYRNAIMKYVIPYLGARQLYALDKRAVNDPYRHLLRTGGRAGAPLSAETVRHVHRTLMKALRDLGIVIDGVRQPRRADRETHGRKGVWTARVPEVPHPRRQRPAVCREGAGRGLRYAPR